MNLRIWGVCGAYAKGVQAPPDVPLFGHLVDVRYVPPVDDGYLDAVPAEGENVFVNVNVQDDVDPFVELMRDEELLGPLHLDDPLETDAVDDGGSTPDDSDGGVPSDREIDRARLFHTSRYHRIQRRIKAGQVHVPRNRGKRPVGEDPDPEYQPTPPRRQRIERLNMPRVDVSQPVQPHPDILQQLLDTITKMQGEMKTQAEEIASLKTEAAKVPELESRLVKLESQLVVLGESGNANETSNVTPPATENVTPTVNEVPLGLEYYPVYTFPGQPVPLNVDYSDVDLEYLQSLVNEGLSDQSSSFDVNNEDVEVEEEQPDLDEVYDDEPPIVEDDSSEDESQQQTAPTAENPTSEAEPSTQAVRLKPAVVKPKRCRFYKVRENLKGLIKCWKFDDFNNVFMLKRSDGVQYFKARFDRLSTLPKIELQRLAQLNLINPNHDGRANFFEIMLRREMNSKKYNMFKPTRGMRYTFKKKIDPITKRPAVKIHYPPARSLKKIPLERIPLNFLRRVKFWEHDSITGEAVIVFVPESEREDTEDWGVKRNQFRVFDPMSLINLSENDLKSLHALRYRFKEADRSEAEKFQRIVDLCFEKGIHAGGVFPSDWK